MSVEASHQPPAESLHPLEVLPEPALAPDSVALTGVTEALAEPADEYRVFTNPYERIEYMHMADDLIVKLDGSAEHDNDGPYDTVIYLDSSARPVNWMVRGLWDFAARKDEAGNPVKQPEVLFANIDARRTGKEISDEDTAELHDTYPTLQVDASATPKRVLIVDEIAVSGDTIDVATARFKEAFPNVTFDGYAWKDERGKSADRIDNVRWYERGVDRYRAVLDPRELKDDQKAQLEEKGIIGAKRWLSVPNPDGSGARQVRAEVERMVTEIKEGKLPFWPSHKRTIDEQDELVTTHNDGLTPREFADFRKWMKRHYSPSPLANLITTDEHGPLTDKEALGYLSDKERREPRPLLSGASEKFADKFGYR